VIGKPRPEPNRAPLKIEEGGESFFSMFYRRKIMAIVLSIIDLLLAVLFVFAGSTKAFQPVEKLAPKMAWVKDFSPRNVKLIGWAELLGGVGLILPGLVGLGILQLTAAICLAVLMVGAVIWHVRNNDIKGAIPSAVLTLLLLILASYMVF
jgi:uncharacterized membrane protein YphA (DoxX/SURF4 family)